ncbi:hypothetical protein HSX11_16900 [Oxalobacteraceae bacterium]|nr:hypothetical protein [Oxalobacteraceae bacterium]
MSRHAPLRPVLLRLASALAALLAAASPGAAVAATPSVLGRIFMTPVERVELDGIRSGVSAQPELVLAPPSAPRETPPPPVLNGVVKRSGGRNTVWINQVPHSEAPANLVNKAPGAPAVSVKLPTGQNVLLQAGQRFDPRDGKIKEIREP